MLLKNASIEEVLEKARGKRFVCFGAGRILKRCCIGYEPLDFIKQVDCIVDNNAEIQGSFYSYGGVQKPIRSLDECIQIGGEMVFFITSDAYVEIFAQLEVRFELAQTDCYIFETVSATPTQWRFPVRSQQAPQKIPKKIHYMWVGGTEIPDQNKKWMESWEKFCPDFEIIRWDESNYDVTKHPYMEAAYTEKKWGFVPDWARLDIIYEHGGIYMDTDVELLRGLDELLYDEAFAGFESLTHVAFGLGFGAVPGHPLIRELRDVYDHVSFYNNDGTLNTKASPVYQTEALMNKGLQPNNTLQLIDGLRIYPTEVLCPLDVWGSKRKLTENSFSIHHFDASWFDKAQKLNKETRLVKTKQFWDRYLFVE